MTVLGRRKGAVVSAVVKGLSLLVVAVVLVQCAIGLTPGDVEYLIPAEFGAVRPLLFDKGLACFAGAWELPAETKTWGPAELQRIKWSRSKRGGLFPSDAAVAYDGWTSGEFRDDEESLRDRAYEVGLGCSPENGSTGKVWVRWAEILDSGQPTYYAFGDEWRYFVGFAPQSATLVIGAFD